MNRTALAFTASVQYENSISRKLVDDLISHLQKRARSTP